MKRLLFVALAVVVSAGCKKMMESPPDNSQGNSGGGGMGGGGSGGAAQAVRGAADRIVNAAELKDLHLFMTTAKLNLGRVPTAQETWAEISQPNGNRQLTKMIQDGILILVANPKDEGLWAYDKNASTKGGWVLTHSEPRRVTAQEFAELLQQ